MRMIARVTLFTALLVSTIGNPLSAEPLPSEIATDFAMFSKALVKALHSENEGVRMAALQQVVHYGDQLDVSDAMFEIVSIYRSDKNENARILALSALASTNDSWAMDFLERSVKFERSERVAKMTRAVVQAQ